MLPFKCRNYCGSCSRLTKTNRIIVFSLDLFFVCVFLFQLVIIIKYIFQFRFIDFNSPDAYLSATFTRTHWLPSILGVEKTDSYATWDLIQLLFIFLHRSYLKNYGLWRDDTEFRQDLQRAIEANRSNVRF